MLVDTAKRDSCFTCHQENSFGLLTVFLAAVLSTAFVIKLSLWLGRHRQKMIKAAEDVVAGFLISTAM